MSSISKQISVQEKTVDMTNDKSINLKTLTTVFEVIEKKESETMIIRH